MRVREAIRDVALRLQDTSDSAQLDAELIAAHMLGVSRGHMLLKCLDEVIDAPAMDALVKRRVAHEPLAYITGYREFWSLDLAVSPGVLIPRPDSETLIEAALAYFGGDAPHTILDLGTGSGALLLAALFEFPDATGVGIDRSETALACAQSNAERLGFADRCEIRLGDWHADIAGQHDLILCNPPYVEDNADLSADVLEYEPAEALFSGADGLDDIRVLAPRIAKILSPDGVACIEIGHTQGASASALFTAQSLKTRLHRDIARRDRCILIHR